MIRPEINATMEDGRPIEVLGKLLERRSEVLGESVRDATIACMINALVSIRAETQSAEKRRKFDIQVDDTGWYGGFSKTEHKPVIRSGVSPYSGKIAPDGKTVWLTHGIRKQCDRHVYRVSPENPDYPPYYVVCASASIALNHERKRSEHRVKQTGGLARNALGVAMGKLAANSSLSGSSQCRSRASTLALVDVSDQGNDYSVRVSDELEYATGALKDGKASIETALMKAANKVSGILKHFGGKSLEEEFGTPFPEVKKK